MAWDLLKRVHQCALDPDDPGAATMIMEEHNDIGSCHHSARPRGERLRLARRKVSGRLDRHRGLTLVEVVLVIGIVAILAGLVVTTYQSYRDRANQNQAMEDIAAISVQITRFASDRGRPPIDLADIGKGAVLDPWGHPYQYVNHATEDKGRFRRDKNIVPINSDFDLYSSGKDGDSAGPLPADASRDDIIRANNGAFIGLASAYDP